MANSIKLCLIIGIFFLKSTTSKLIKRSNCLNNLKKFVAISSICISPCLISPETAWSDISWTERNTLAAETWKAVDEGFYDRSFNGNDWFKLRQSVVKREYKTDEELFDSLKDMLTNLGDKYTRFLTPTQYSTLVNSAKGELTGVGVELLPKDENEVQIAQVFDNSPAKGSGLIAGDLIVNVDGKDTKGVSPEEVASLLRGEKGTKASIRVQRGDKNFDYIVIREPFKFKAVTGSRQNVKGKEVAFLSIRSFDFSTCDNIVALLSEMKQKGPIDSIVLDLRNNGGGLLQGAVQTSNVFLPPGKTVVFITGKDGESKAQNTLPNGLSTQDSNIPDTRTKMYIVINKNTASAAEVLAAGLKENDRATLVGEKSFGKGVIQNLQELRFGSGVAVTTAKYETPLHHDINKIGINADVSVDCDGSLSVEACADKFL